MKIEKLLFIIGTSFIIYTAISTTNKVKTFHGGNVRKIEKQRQVEHINTESASIHHLYILDSGHVSGSKSSTDREVESSKISTGMYSVENNFKEGSSAVCTTEQANLMCTIEIYQEEIIVKILTTEGFKKSSAFYLTVMEEL